MNHKLENEFRSLGPDFPIIAAFAAAEVDKLIRNEDSTHENLNKLAEILASSIESDGASVRSLLDPVGINVLSKAYAVSHGHTPKSMSELSKLSKDFITHLKGIDNNMPGFEVGLLEIIKKFCLALSTFALSSKNQATEAQPNVKFKRVICTPAS